MYSKTINGKLVISACKTIQTQDGIWISNPTPEQIAEAGWEVYIPEPAEFNPNAERKREILRELESMDYLTSKYIDGEDMTQYGDWQEHRRQLRAEYRTLENE